MQDARPLLRQWLLLRSLSSRRRGCAVREMADEAGVSQKTVRRDLQTLKQVGFPIEETVGERGRKQWKLADDGLQPGMTFTLTEVMSLYLGRRFLEPLAGTHFWDGTHSAFQKIRSVLGEQALQYLEKLAVILHVTTPGSSDYSRKAEIIDGLMVGIEDRRIAFIIYQSMRATEPVTYEVYPLGLIHHRGSLYLVAHSVEHEETRHFKLDRIGNVDLEMLRFATPEDFNVKSHLAGSFGVYHSDGPPIEVKVKFLPAVARYVLESRWHDSQKLTQKRDGSVVVTFQLSTTEEIKSWILSFGANAVVLEPKRLAVEIRTEAMRIAEAYRVRSTKVQPR